MRRPLLVTCLLAILAAGSAAPVGAHTRSLSYSSWQIGPDGAQVSVRIPRLELSRLPHLDATGADDRGLGRYLAGHLSLRSESDCRVEAPPSQRRAAEGWVAFRWTLACDGPPVEIESAILRTAAPSHLHFARIARSEAAAVERVLSAHEPSWTFDGPDGDGGSGAGGSSLGSYLVLGVEHILTGWDHLAFVIALLLLASRLGEVARLVTGFTVAHSVTLALAVLGWVHPNAAAVEALIGYSVALVAIENSWTMAGRARWLPTGTTLALAGVVVLALGGVGSLSVATSVGLLVFTAAHFALLDRTERPGNWRAALAFGFGLVHGFGFAGILAEMTLPTERLVPALFGFNVGVELGQLGVVALAWPLMRYLARLRLERITAEVLSAGICGIGLFWFLTRAFG